MKLKFIGTRADGKIYLGERYVYKDKDGWKVYLGGVGGYFSNGWYYYSYSEMIPVRDIPIVGI